MESVSAYLDELHQTTQVGLGKRGSTENAVMRKRATAAPVETCRIGLG